VIIFGSVQFLSKKVTKPKFFFLKKKTETEPKPTGFGSVRFFGKKPVQTGLARFSRFGSVFSGFGSVFSVWLGFSGLAQFWLGFAQFFFGFLSVSVRFGFFGFLLIKPKPNRTRTEPAGFFKNLIGLIGFFFGSVFSVIFFPVFSV
jgi:hypothetical protein